MKKCYYLIFSILALFFVSQNTSVAASHIDTYTEKIEVVSRETIISEYAQKTGVSTEEATQTLFPDSSLYAFRSIAPTSEQTVYVRMSARATQHSTLTSHIRNNVGHVYFYCEISQSGWSRGIKRIIYAGYQSGVLSFQGDFQYHLQDANHIHYTLNGHLYNYTTSSTNVGGSVGQGGTASLSIEVGSSSNYYGPIYYHGDRYY